MKNRYVSIILVLIMVLAVIPSVSFASYDPSVDDIFDAEPVVTTVTTTTNTTNTAPTSSVTTNVNKPEPSNPDVVDPSNPDVSVKPSQPTTKPTTKPTEPHVHAYSGRMTKQPSCIADGIKTFYCNCGDTYTEDVPKLDGHKTIVKVSDSTYFKNGSKTKSCVLCGKIFNKVTLNKKVLSKSVFKLVKGDKKFKVNYKKVSKARGFQVRYKIKGKWKVKTFNIKRSVTRQIKNLTDGTYKVQVRVFRKLSGKIVYSRWTKSRKVTV